MNAAWGGVTLEDEITICIDTAHRTWANIAARKAFTVAFGTADAVACCDYLGLVSGNKVRDKVAQSGFTLVKSAFVDAPVINELLLVLECRLVSMNEENCSVVGKIVNCAIEESALTDGKPDAAKMKPLCFDTCSHAYRLMGDVVAAAFCAPCPSSSWPPVSIPIPGLSDLTHEMIQLSGVLPFIRRNVVYFAA